MKAQTRILVDDLERMGVILTCNNNRLSIDAPAGVITPSIKEQLKKAKPEIINRLLLTRPALAHTNRHPANSALTTRMAIYHIRVSGKPVTVLDSTAMPEPDMKRVLADKFGDRLQSVVRRQQTQGECP